MTYKLKKNSGITLTSVVVTVIILIIISTMLALRASESITTDKLNKMYNDIKTLQDRVLIYYSENKQLPKGDAFSVDNLEGFQEQRNNLDSDVYYEIDLSKLDNIMLSFGNKKNNDSSDVYIVNEKTLSVYYAKGITLNGKIYYTLPKEGQEQNITVVPLEDKKNRLTISENLGIANSPDLKQGMTPIAYLDNDEQKVEDAINDYWYDYSNEVKKFANMKLNDGSLYVWIPRFAIDISNNIKFVNTENKCYNASTKSYEEITGYSVPNGFDYNGISLPGIWVAKYEASGDNEKIVTILNEDKTTEAQRWGRILLESEKIDKTSNITLIEANGINKQQAKSLLIDENDESIVSNFISKYAIGNTSNNKYAIYSGSGNSNLAIADINTDNFSFRPKIISVESNYNTTNENIAYETSENVPIPKGFYYLMGSKDTGLVITSDYKGRAETDNEFVWIPVDDYSKFKRYDWTTWDGTSDISTVEVLDNTSDYKEAGPEGNTITTDESIAMYSSVEEYKGFYIGRYEAILDNYPGITSSNGYYTDIGTPLLEHVIPKSMSTKKFENDNMFRVFVWATQFEIVLANESIGIGLDGFLGNDKGYSAAKLARSMYPDTSKLAYYGLDEYTNISNETGAISTLMYGVQWDAIMYFLKDVQNPYRNAKFILDSNDMGNYTVFLDIPLTAEYTVKNICDLAGNLSEWTMESTTLNGDQVRVARGGSSERSRNGQHIDASGRLPWIITKLRSNLCVRPALYIKQP